MEEVWKQVVVKGKQYLREVSNKGRCRKPDGSFCKLANNGAGYFSVAIDSFVQEDGTFRCKREYIHRLVAMMFLDNPENLPQVNHRDYDKTNNNLENLEWCTKSYNIKDAHAKGRMIKRTTEAAICILTEQQVIDLYTAVKRDRVGISEQARRMGLPRTTASSILNKRSRRDITDKLDKEFACV